MVNEEVEELLFPNKAEIVNIIANGVFLSTIIFWRPGTHFHEFQHFLEHPIPEFF